MYSEKFWIIVTCLYFTGTFGRGGRGPAPLSRGGGTQVGNKSQNKSRPK